MRKMSIFAPDEIKQNRTHFSQESLYEATRAVICEILQEAIVLVISGLQN